MSEEKTVDRKDIYMARCVLLLSAAVLALWLALGRGGEARTVRVEPVQAMSDFFTDRAALRVPSSLTNSRIRSTRKRPMISGRSSGSSQDSSLRQCHS